MKTPPPRSPELEALLAPHRTVLPVAPSVVARAIARAAAATASPEHGAAGASGRPRWVLAVAAGAVLAFGAGAYGAWIAAPSRPVPADVKAIASPGAGEPDRAIVAVTPETDVSSASLARPHTRHGGGRTIAASTAPTNAELRLLRAARENVTRGDFTAALAVIAEHVRKFRNGSLVEEREALRVKSLDGLGRHDDARRAAAAFHARFPHSVFLSTFSTFERMKDADR